MGMGSGVGGEYPKLCPPSSDVSHHILAQQKESVGVEFMTGCEIWVLWDM